MTRTPCRRRTGEALPRAEKFGDLITADHKVLNEGCVSRDNHQYPVVVQDLATQWIQSYPCKTKTSHETEKEFVKSSWNRHTNQKSFTPATHWNLENNVKISPGIIARLHHTDRRLMVLLNEQCAEWKKGHLLYCCYQVWMKIGGLIPWSVIAVCETFKISCLMERHHMKGGSECLLTDLWCRSEQWSNILSLRRTYRSYATLVQKSCQVISSVMFFMRVESGKETLWSQTLKNWKSKTSWQMEKLRNPISARELSRIHQFGKKLLPWIFLGYQLIAETIWKGDILTADLEDLEKLLASEVYPRRINAKELLISHKGDAFCFPSSGWYSKIVRKRLRISRTHSKAGTNREERRFQQRTSWWTGRVSSDGNKRWH